MTRAFHVRRLAAVVALLACAGCYRATFTTRTRTTNTSPVYNERWNHSVVWGMIPLSDAVDLDAACPGGEVSEIHEELSFLNGLVSVGTQLAASYAVNTVTRTGIGMPIVLYRPRTVTVRCGLRGNGFVEPPPAPELTPTPP